VIIFWVLVILASVALIVWGAETFAEHLGAAAVRLNVSMFALSLLLAGAEPEELVTALVASLRDLPGIALGDVIGANVAICLVALGVGALVAPLPFGTKVRRYALFSVPVGAIATGFVWDGDVSRFEGGVLVALYLLYVAVIWIWERKPPALGETQELEEAMAELEANKSTQSPQRIGRELLLVLAGVGAMAGGATLLVEAVRQISQVEETQTALGLTLIGFATAFELVVLAWSAARRNASEVVVAGVVGSFAYNVTMTLGVAAIARPLKVLDANLLHIPLIVMLASLILVILLAIPRGSLGRVGGGILLLLYPLFVVTILVS
jgi:cation:H+ antiporter